MIELRIPQSAFDPGGPLYGKDKKSAKLAFSFRGISLSTVGVNSVVIDDDSIFHPAYSKHHEVIIHLIRTGLLEFVHNGSVLTVDQVIDLYKVRYQEI